MRIRHFLPRLLVLSCAVSVLMSVGSTASAAAPDDPGTEKGTLAAASTEIDRSGYTDGSVYENEPAGVDIVKIGLRYGDNAVSSAYIANPSGEGFLVGFYDGDRVFHQLSSCDEASVVVSRSTNWHILIDGGYDNFYDARLAALSYGGFAAFIDGEYRVLYGSFGSRDAAERKRDQFRLKGEAYFAGESALVLSASKPVLLLDDAGGFALMPEAAAGKARFLFEGNGYYGGVRFTPWGDNGINVVNYLELEDYVKGVIPYEMSASWPYEALKAQAICARTYVVFNQNAYEEYDFDLTDDTESQVYRGYTEATETTDRAVDETAGLYVRYEGKICNIYYFASSGGASEDGKNVFGVNEPYLSGKIDPFEDAVDYNIKDWTSYRGGSDMAWQLSREGYTIGTVTELIPEYSANGNVIAMTYCDENRNRLRLEGRDCYSLIRLNNCRFTVSYDGYSFRFTGDGWGHNCGMSQWGANAMAGVYGYDCEDIIRFYFTGAYIA